MVLQLKCLAPKQALLTAALVVAREAREFPGQTTFKAGDVVLLSLLCTGSVSIASGERYPSSCAHQQSSDTFTWRRRSKILTSDDGAARMQRLPSAADGLLSLAE